MRKICTSAVLVMFSAFLQANEVKQDNLFNCVDPDGLTLDSQCLSNAIESNQAYQSFDQTFQNEISDLGGNAMATVLFHPEKMWIQIIAHDDSDGNTLALHTSSKKSD
ncbi:MAG: hypothetical protein ACFHVJ_06475 [Aestuariibacter sp.]